MLEISYGDSFQQAATFMWDPRPETQTDYQEKHPM